MDMGMRGRESVDGAVEQNETHGQVTLGWRKIELEMISFHNEED